MEIQTLGRWLLGIGIVIALLGLALTFIPKIPFFGRLPGDIVVRREHFSFYFPLTTGLILSLLLTFLLNLFSKK